MKCEKTEIVQAIQNVAQAVSNNPQTPILSAILLKAQDGRLELQATDYEISIACSVPASFEEPAIEATSGKYLQEVSRNLSGEEVSLEQGDDNTLKIKSGATTFSLLRMVAGEFPQLARLASDVSFEIKGEVLKNLIRKTIFACAKEESRPIFTGCLLEVEGHDVRMAATNAHRIAIYRDKIEGDVGGKKQYVVPSRVLEKVLNTLSAGRQDTVVVTCTPVEVSFTFGDLYIASRLIDGQFPDYQKNVPPAFATKVLMSTPAFLAALGRVDMIARSLDYNVLRLAFADGKAHLWAVNPEVGEAEEDVPADITGDPIATAFNANYLRDVLKCVDGDRFYFLLNKVLYPAGIREVGELENPKYDYIVTPVRTHG